MLARNKKQETKNKGFTLIEMAVVTAIFGILTSVVIFNYGNFTDNILSTNMAYEVALQVRQAQVFGLGVRGVDGQFGGAYGVFVNTKNSDATTKDIILFNDSKPLAGPDGKCGDSSGSGVCVCNTGDECLEKISLQRNIVIDELRVKGSGASCNPTDLLSVTFKRPNPDAVITDQDGGGSNFELAEIRINSPRSDKPRYVIIRNTGQISVEQDSNCE